MKPAFTGQCSDRAYSRGMALLLGLGAVIRLYAYLYNRSLWYDEAMLAHNLLHKSFAELGGMLDFGQIAPLGFLWVEKCAMLLFGSSEYALRLIPFLCAIVSLWLFDKLSRRLFSPGWALVALAFFAFHGPHIYFAVELKQYSTDVFVALLLIYGSLWMQKEEASWKRLAGFALLCALAVWFSQAAVFVVAGLSLVHLMKTPRTNWLFWNAAWILSFGLYYFLFLQDRIQQEGLAAFHQAYFMPLQFWQPESWTWYFDHFFHVFRNPGGFLFKYLAAVAALFGIYGLPKRRPLLLKAYLLALVLAFLVSAFQLYSTIPRVLLFAAPAVIWLVVEGLSLIQQVLSRLPAANYNRYLPQMLVVVLFLQPFLNVMHRIVEPEEVEDMKSALEYYLQNRKEGDRLYVYHYALPAFEYYKKRYVLKNRVMKGRSPWEAWQADFDGIGTGRLWLLFSHYQRGNSDDRQLFASYLDGRARQLRAQQFRRSGVYLYRFPTIEIED